jgi:hypothetical protein
VSNTIQSTVHCVLNDPIRECYVKPYDVVLSTRATSCAVPLCAASSCKHITSALLNAVEKLSGTASNAIASAVSLQ